MKRTAPTEATGSIQARGREGKMEILAKMWRRSVLLTLATLTTLGSGLLNLYSLTGPALPERMRLLRDVFPLEFLHLSRFLTLLIGFALTISAINIYKRKRRAFQSVFLLSGLSIGFQLTKGLDYEEATFSGVLLGLLFLTRHSFTVRSSAPDWRWALNRLLVAIGAATGYGIAGFWLLDPREFGMNFTLGDAIHRTLPGFLPIYMDLGYRRLKIGDDAVVDLTQFVPEGKERKKLRSRVNQFEKQGITTEYFEPPLSDAVLTQAREVSEEWLQIPGRRERGFTLGMFEPEYVRSTPLFAVKDKNGRFLAFASMIPSFCKGEATIDLMRHRLQAPNGTMDYLFIKLFLLSRVQGFTRFNLGMAPMAGFQEHEQATREERAIHYFMQQLNFLFSFSGLRQYKAKFASIWEPRYAVYQSALDLPRLALALRAVSELPD